MFLWRWVSSEAREDFFSFSRRGFEEIFAGSAFVEGHCHASGGRQESDCGSLGLKTRSLFVVPVREGSVVDSSVRLSFGIGDSSVDVVGDLLRQKILF